MSARWKPAESCPCPSCPAGRQVGDVDCSHAESWNDAVERLKYAEKLIEAMGAEIVAWTHVRKKVKAAAELRRHLQVVRGELPVPETPYPWEKE